jgi:Family of unknown function (DUF6526)
MDEQSFKNHTRRDPLYLFLVVLALLCFIASIVHLVQEHSRANILLLFVTFTVLGLIPFVRSYSLKVQDRLIRLEEQTRLRWLGVDSSGLTIKQFVALRFASDNEVGALTARAKAEKLTPKQIKEAIVTWRPDFDRV